MSTDRRGRRGRPSESAGPSAQDAKPAGPTRPDESAGPADPTTTWDPSGTELARSVAASFSASGASRSGRRRETRARGTDRLRADWKPTRSGAGPDDRDPQLLEDTIDRLVAERGWVREVTVAGALARWDQIVGPEIAAHCRAERYADAELTVRADSTAWATQVRLLAPTLVKRLNEELGDGTVRRVTVLGPDAPSWRKGPLRVRGGRGPRDTYG